MQGNERLLLVDMMFKSQGKFLVPFKFIAGNLQDPLDRHKLMQSEIKT